MNGENRLILRENQSQSNNSNILDYAVNIFMLLLVRFDTFHAYNGNWLKGFFFSNFFSILLLNGSCVSKYMCFAINVTWLFRFMALFFFFEKWWDYIHHTSYIQIDTRNTKEHFFFHSVRLFVCSMNYAMWVCEMLSFLLFIHMVWFDGVILHLVFVKWLCTVFFHSIHLLYGLFFTVFNTMRDEKKNCTHNDCIKA